MFFVPLSFESYHSSNEKLIFSTSRPCISLNANKNSPSVGKGWLWIPGPFWQYFISTFGVSCREFSAQEIVKPAIRVERQGLR